MSTSEGRRVVITGVGMVTPLGSSLGSTWHGLLDGTSAIRPITAYDPSLLQTRLGAEITDFQVDRFVTNRKTLRMMHRVDQYAFAAAAMAVKDAGWSLAEMDRERGGVFAGGGKEVSDLGHLKEAVLAARAADGTVDDCRFARSAVDTAYPLFYVEGLPAAILFFISEALKIQGANAYFSGTAEAGSVAIGSAFRAVRRGEVDYALAGGSDDAVGWWTMSRLDGIGVLTPQNELGAAAFRPFDADRSGSVLGEGAVYLAMETEDLARARGARPYAELSGFGSAFNAHSLLTPDRGGEEVGAAIEGALREAGDGLETGVPLLIAHGSATRLGDPSEVRGVRAALGGAADRLIATSVKASTGHLGAAAGCLNAAVAALCLRDGTVPASLNLEHPDPACDLDWVRERPRGAPVTHALAMARGLEGQCSALLLRRSD